MKISQTSGLSVFLSEWGVGDRHHRGFIKFQNFDGQHGQDDNMHHLTKFCSDR